MSQTSPEKSGIRFLSFTNNDEDAEKEATLKEAAAKIEQAIARDKSLGELIDFTPATCSDQPITPENDTRSLFERLQEQKDKKKETLEEASKLSNFVAQLDEDDVCYLNDLAKNKQEEELRKRLEVHDALEAKKRLDEQKMLDEEKRLKNSLLGINSNTINLTQKSKLSSMIKLKVKTKTRNDMSKSNLSANEQEVISESNASSSSHSKRPIDLESRTKDSPNKKFSSEISHDKDSELTSENQTYSDPSDSQCDCASKVTKVLGILPSLAIIKRHPTDSDDSDSWDDIDSRLMPRTRRRK